MDCPLESAKGSSDRNRSPGTEEQEWVRVTLSDVKRSFSTALAPSVRPTGSGVNIVVRNLARLSEAMKSARASVEPCSNSSTGNKSQNRPTLPGHQEIEVGRRNREAIEGLSPTRRRLRLRSIGSRSASRASCGP